MGFTQIDEGFWIKKTDVTPQKRSHKGSDFDANIEDEEEETITRTPSTAIRTPNVTRTLRKPYSPPWFPSLHMGSSSRIPPSSSYKPQLGSFEVSFGEIKEEQKKLGHQEAVCCSWWAFQSSWQGCEASQAPSQQQHQCGKRCDSSHCEWIEIICSRCSQCHRGSYGRR